MSWDCLLEWDAMPRKMRMVAQPRAPGKGARRADDMAQEPGPGVMFAMTMQCAVVPERPTRTPAAGGADGPPGTPRPSITTFSGAVMECRKRLPLIAAAMLGVAYFDAA